MCHSLAETKGDTVQEYVEKVAVDHLGIVIAAIDIVQVSLDSTCLSEITYLIKSPV